MPTPSDPTKPRISRQGWLIIATLAAVNFTHMVDFVIMMPLGKMLMTEFKIDQEQFSHLIAAYGLSAGVASILASVAFDRFDRKYVLAFAYAGFIVGTLCCGLASNYETMLLARGLAGVFGGLASAAMMSVVGDAFRPEQRGTATGMVMSAFAVASVAGLPIGLQIAGTYGRAVPFYALAGLGLGVLAAILFVLPNFREHLKAKRSNPAAEFAIALKEPRHLWAFAFTLSLVLGTFTVASFIGPYYLTENPTWTEQHELAVVYFAAGLCTLLTMNVVGRLADIFPKRNVFVALGLASLVMCLVVTNVPVSSLWLAATLLSVFMLCAVGRMIPAQAMLIGVALPRNRGAFMSLNTAVSNFATGLAPLIAGKLIVKGADGALTHYWRVGIFAACAAGLSLYLSRFVRPVTPHTPGELPDAATVKVGAPEGEREAVAV